ncbi:MAG TPA: hypothetical protein DHV31_00325, partial [Clostridiales bacterium]|nr:hypothetical protein [Clostridiales bacterium]
PLFTAEDVVYAGSLSEHLSAMGYSIHKAFTLPNTYVTFGKPAELRSLYRIDAASIAEEILNEA